MSNLQKIFQDKYNRTNFIAVIKSTFANQENKIEIINDKKKEIQLNETDKKIAKQIIQYNQLKTKEGKTIDLYEVHLQDHIQIERNRVAVASLIKSHFIESSVALVTFYNDNKKLWRFSFIAHGNIAENTTEVVGFKTQTTNPKRYTYLFGDTNQTYRTAISRFEELKQLSTITITDLKEAFGVEALNKDFFDDIKSWYDRALKKINFPNDLGEQDANKKGLIRLLTRLVFCWFLKEKGLIPKEVFSKNDIQNFLDIEPNTSTYYKAVLQNLFFATLNKPMVKDGKTTREFRKAKQHYNITHLYRYEKLFKENKAQQFIDKYFKDIPFLNGGLFECLDKESESEKTAQGNAKVIRVDGFSDRDDNTLTFPNLLFWDNSKDDKSDGEGLLQIFDRYQFTLDESSPEDELVALDPEMLGKIFENLLATTQGDAQEQDRKNTGSFYTPRSVVHFMVRQSLEHYFQGKGIKNIYDFDQNPQPNQEQSQQQSQEQKQHIIKAINDIKIFDPACGSGAFPMGALNELVYILEQIDPNNELWKERQICIVEKLEDHTQREEAIKNIEEAFEHNELGYGRKLYLIQNCIYGVDIQNIAVQISKLRFFISLLIDQKIDDKKPNKNIRPLPNLETKFVVGDALARLDLKNWNLFSRKEEEILKEVTKKYISESSKSITVKDILLALKEVRGKYFFAKTSKTKNKYKQEDKDLRIELGTFGDDNTAQKIAGWDLYNQNAETDWFDPEFMFGVSDGFDLIIGNPPYIQLQKNGGKLGNKYAPFGYESFAKTGDIYALFYERGNHLLKSNGHLCFITSNKWMRAGYGKRLRNYFIEQTTPKVLIDLGAGVFESATVDSNILLFKNAKPKGDEMIDVLSVQTENNKQKDLDKVFATPKSKMPIPPKDEPWSILSPEEFAIKARIEEIGKPLKYWDISINYGIKTGYNDAFIIDEAKRQELLNNCQSEEERQKTAGLIKPILRGRDIKKYEAKWAGLYLIFIPWHFPLHKDETITGNSKKAEQELKKQYPAIYNHLLAHKEKLSKRNKAETGIRYEWYALQRCANTYYQEFEKEKIVYPETTQGANFYFDNKDFYFLEKTCFMMVGENLKYLTALLSSKPLEYSYKKFYSGCDLSNTGYQYNKHSLENLPIPQLSSEEQKPFEILVDYILFCKTQKGLDTEAWYFEKIIDSLVYEIYFAEEIKAVANLYITDTVREVLQDVSTQDITKKMAKALNDSFRKHDVFGRNSLVLGTVKPVKVIRSKA